MKKYLISLILFSQAILADPFYGEKNLNQHLLQ